MMRRNSCETKQIQDTWSRAVLFRELLPEHGFAGFDRGGCLGQNSAFRRWYVVSNDSGNTRVSPITVMKFASATQRGSACI